MATKDIKPRTETGLTRREVLGKALRTGAGAVASSALDTSILGGLADLATSKLKVAPATHINFLVNYLLDLEREKIDMEENPDYVTQGINAWEAHKTKALLTYEQLVTTLKKDKGYSLEKSKYVAGRIMEDFYSNGLEESGKFYEFIGYEGGDPSSWYMDEDIPEPAYSIVSEEEQKDIINKELSDTISIAVKDYSDKKPIAVDYDSFTPEKLTRTDRELVFEDWPTDINEPEDLEEDDYSRLIESAADLARRLAAPPTGTVPRQVKPPVQQPKPTQPKIPAPRATMEQPTEQGRGLSNIVRMLPAVGRRLPFIAPAAALLRSKPAGEGSDIVPPDPLGTGRVYRNYHDYNPRNI